jgi:hypothetical protein
MDTDERSAQVERLEVVETGRRRRWSEDEKVKIVLESLQAHVRSRRRRGDMAFRVRCCCDGDSCFIPPRNALTLQNSATLPNISGIGLFFTLRGGLDDAPYGGLSMWKTRKVRPNRRLEKLNGDVVCGRPTA